MFNRKTEIRRAVKLSDTKEQVLKWLWKPYYSYKRIIRPRVNKIPCSIGINVYIWSNNSLLD